MIMPCHYCFCSGTRRHTMCDVPCHWLWGWEAHLQAVCQVMVHDDNMWFKNMCSGLSLLTDRPQKTTSGLSVDVIAHKPPQYLQCRHLQTASSRCLTSTCCLMLREVISSEDTTAQQHNCSCSQWPTSVYIVCDLCKSLGLVVSSTLGPFQTRTMSVGSMWDSVSRGSGFEPVGGSMISIQCP